jgi:hypothetical protein
MRARPYRLLAISVASLGLCGCQLDYDLDVVVLDGQVAFKLSDGRGNPAPLETLIVKAVSSQPRTVWRLESTKLNGVEIGEVRFGKAPSGFRETTRAERLAVGQLYRVTMFAVGGGESQEFVISNSDPGGRAPIVLH